MKRIPVMLSLFAAASSLLSCRKDLEEATPQAPESAVLSRPAQLASSSWHQTGLLVRTTAAGTVTEADLFAHVSPKTLDELASFQADGTLAMRKGGAESTPHVGRWLLSSTGDSITLTLPRLVRHLALTELSASTMRLAYTDAATNGSVTTYTSVYSRLVP